MKQKSDQQQRHSIRGFNTKGYFHMVEPYCEQYLKAKHESYQKTKRLREAKNAGKQNSGNMFQFNKPKSGYYALKGCRAHLSKIDEEGLKNQVIMCSVLEKPQQKVEFVSYFMKKYSKRKQKLNKRELSEQMLPAVRSNLVSISVKQQPKLYSHSTSIGVSSDCLPTHSQSKLNIKKLRTEPICRRKNFSCQQLQSKHKLSTLSNI